jgi:hypothetical protein
MTGRTAVVCRLIVAATGAGLTGSAAAQDAPAPAAPPAAPATAPATTAQQELPATPPQGLQWTVGDYTVKLGGYVKVDLIHDFNEIGSTDSFDPRTIDPADSDGTNTRLHARQTRFHLDIRRPTGLGELRAFFEGDFFGANTTFRIRHAYGSIAGWLAGQTWSTFMDEDAMPETLDFESPIAFPLIRQAMIRYTWDLGGDSLIAVALEDPASSLIDLAAPGEAEEATPDLTSRLRWGHQLGHTQLGLFLGQARYDRDVGPTDTEVLWGMNLSTKLAVGDRDHLFVQATYGPGVGRYRGGITAAPDANDELQAVEAIAGMLGYEHHWSAQWRSTVTYSYGTGEVPAGAPTDSIETVEYLAANLIWQLTEGAWVGVEYLYGARENVDEARGEAHRVQFAFKFSF